MSGDDFLETEEEMIQRLKIIFVLGNFFYIFPFNSDHLLWKQRPVVKVWQHMAFRLLRLHTWCWKKTSKWNPDAGCLFVSTGLSPESTSNRCLLMNIFVMLQDWPSSLDQYYGIRLETYGTSMGLEDDVNLSDASPARYEKFLQKVGLWVIKRFATVY